MAEFVAIDRCPVPRALAPSVRSVRSRTGASLSSCYRGNDPAGVAILRAYGKHSQQQLSDASPAQRAEWGVLGTPNPPGGSTHECKSDGVAYNIPWGRDIAPYFCGMDWPDGKIPEVMRAFRAIGDYPIHPYAAGVEYHHINLAAEPRWIPDLRIGDRGRHVWLLTHRMAVAGYLPHSGLWFNAHVKSEVQVFQRRMHLEPDGLVGPHTWLNIAVAARAARRKQAHR